MYDKEISRRSFVQVSMAGCLTALATGVSPAAETTEQVARKRLTVTNGAAVRILQFTDVHFFNGITKRPEEEEKQRIRTQEDMRRLVDHANPDLIMVTGDLWHENPDGRGAEFMEYALNQIGLLGVPWAFAWGNHDSLDSYEAGHRALAGAQGSQYAGGGLGGNYVLVLEDASGAPLVELFCLDSGKEGLGEEARAFIGQAIAADAGAPKPMRLAACHIPVRQYHEVWENKAATGIIGEIVCSEKEDGTTLAALRDARIQAVFCGHDHENDYSGRMAGVEMIYGRATGYAGYGHEKVPKGGKVYTLDPARKSMEWLSLLPDGTAWKPAPGERIEKWG